MKDGTCEIPIAKMRTMPLLHQFFILDQGNQLWYLARKKGWKTQLTNHSAHDNAGRSRNWTKGIHIFSKAFFTTVYFKISVSVWQGKLSNEKHCRVNYALFTIYCSWLCIWHDGLCTCLTSTWEKELEPLKWVFASAIQLLTQGRKATCKILQILRE